MSARGRAAVLTVGLVTVGLVGGCPGGLDLLNPEFVSALGGGARIASVPGTAPSVLVAIENRTQLPARMTLSYRLKDKGVVTTTYQIVAGGRTAQALLCPVQEMTCGIVTDASASGAQLLLATGGAFDDTAPFIEVEPFGVIMKESVNYDCGDAITFAVEPSGVTVSGYRIFAYIERAGNP